MSSDVQVLVVGAGEAGIAAARTASESGASVVLLDEQSMPGGWLRTSIATIEEPPGILGGIRGIEVASNAARWLAGSQVDYRPGSIAWGLFEQRSVGVVGPNGAYQIQPERVILATGSTEIIWPFRGWTLPGVMTARAARTFMHLHLVLPGRNVAVVGAGPDAEQMAVDLGTAGATVVRHLETPDGLTAGGATSVEWVESGGERTSADAVVLALGSLPDPELARHAVVDLIYSAADGCHVPVRDAHMQTSEAGIYVVGDAGGLTTVTAAAAQGEVAGYAAAGSGELAGAIQRLTEASVPSPAHTSVGDPSHIPDDVQVDREEQVTAGQIREAISGGAVSINDVKRRTRAGMGVSQGRDTEYVITRMIQSQTGIPLDQLLPMTARPPARLVSLATLAEVANATA